MGSRRLGEGNRVGSTWLSGGWTGPGGRYLEGDMPSLADAICPQIDALHDSDTEDAEKGEKDSLPFLPSGRTITHSGLVRESCWLG